MIHTTMCSAYFIPLELDQRVGEECHLSWRERYCDWFTRPVRRYGELCRALP